MHCCLIRVMRSIQASVNLLITVLGVLWVTSALMTAMAATTTDVAVASTVTGSGMFNPRATLDTAQIDDLRPAGVVTDTATDDATAEGSVTADPREVIRLPEGYALETTPMVPVSGTRYVVPEESPDGGHALPVVLWLDNSPVYSGPQSWVLHVDDTQQRVTWRLYVDVVRDVNDPAGDESGPVQTVAQVTTTAAPTTLSKVERQAVRLILDRQHSGRPMFEDLTWRGAPRVVGQANDALLERFESTGQHYSTTNLHKWLHKLARTGRA